MREAMIVWGGWEGHDPEEFANLYRRWLHEDGFSVRIETETAAFADPDLSKLSLIVPVFSKGKITKDEVSNLAAAVEAGVGIAGHHGGMCDAFPEMPAYQFITGGQFAAHPGGMIDFSVNVRASDDPIMAGIRDFSFHSEQYYMLVDPSNEVLATTTFSGEHAAWTKGVVMPVVWKRRYGLGKVFYSSLGHKVSEFDHPAVATIMRRGLNWAARGHAED